MSAAEFPSPDQLGGGAAGAIAGQFDRLFRIFLAGPEASRDGKSFRYITGEPHPLGNAAIIHEDATPDEISGVLRDLLAGEFPSAAVLMGGAAPEQVGAVTSAGYVPAETMPLMSVDAAGLRETSMPEGYTLREVGAADDQPWSEAMANGYGLPLSLGVMLGPVRASELCEPGSVRYFAAEHGGAIVATSMLYLQGGLAGIYGVATLPEHRGKGLGAHLSAEPLRLAWGEGYRAGVLQASAMGAPVYRRIGYGSHGEMALFVRMPGVG